MSKFFRSAGSDNSSETSSSDSESEASLRSGQGVDTLDASGLSLGNNVLVPVNSSTIQGFDNKDLMAHALLEDRCLHDVRKELAGSSEETILSAATQRYKTVSARLIGVGLLAPALNADVHAQARKHFRQGLDLLSQNSNGRKVSAEVNAPFRRLLPGADAGNALAVRDMDLQLAYLPESIPPALNHLVDQPKQNAFGNSRYRQDFEELGVLGKGGYGVVYSCRHKLDGVTYAIKKVPLSASRRERIIAHGQAETDALLSEVRTLAQLDHPNIVRYFNGWIDWINVDGLAFASSDEVQLGSEDTQLSEGISFGRVITESDDDHITFENSISRGATRSTVTTTNDSAASESGKALRRTASQGTRATVSEDGIESISRHNSSDPSESMATDTDGIKLDGAGPQLALHIQMALYPMTLASFLATDSPSEGFGEVMPLRHCFHLQPSVRILLAILEGVDYLHRHNMVHRDLKPGNVFMTPCHDPRSEGSIDLFSCDGCWTTATEDTVCGTERGVTSERPSAEDNDGVPIGEPCTSVRDPSVNPANTTTALSLATSSLTVAAAPHKSPRAPEFYTNDSTSKAAIHVRIGDLGLVTALAQSDHEDDASLNRTPVGTELYRAPSVSNTSPALDIYALGIIAFELLWPFGTRMERHSTIHALKEGCFPARFAKKVGDTRMEECIGLMLRAQVEIGEVRDRLLKML